MPRKILPRQGSSKAHEIIPPFLPGEILSRQGAPARTARKRSGDGVEQGQKGRKCGDGVREGRGRDGESEGRERERERERELGLASWAWQVGLGELGLASWVCWL